MACRDLKNQHPINGLRDISTCREVRKALEKGSSGDGATPLMVACEMGDLSIVR